MTLTGNSPSPNPQAQESLPLSLLNDLLYCPRRAALKAVEGWRAANEHTVRGDSVHDRMERNEPATREKWKRLGVPQQPEAGALTHLS